MNIVAKEPAGAEGSSVGKRRPLKRFKVLDLTHARAGPVAVRQLSDWGADVCRVEPTASMQLKDDLVGKRHSGDFQNLHRNKRSIGLDLKSPRGRQIFIKLLHDADVLVENMRPDVKYRLGVDYEAVHKVNPRIVYGSISGYGEDGPYGKRGGVDQIAQGIGGLMSITGLPGQGPLRVGIAIADIAAGMFLANGILAALLDREVTGVGTWVRTSLLQSMVAMLDGQAMRYLVDGHVPSAVGNDHPTGVPMGTFQTAGDEYINIAASSQRLFGRFCEAAGLQHLITDEKFSSVSARSKNADELRSIIALRLRLCSAKEWVERLNAAGVPCGPVLNIEQVFDDPQVRHLRVTRPVQHPTMGKIDLLASPLEIEGASKELEKSTPEIGEHSKEILSELGYDMADIQRFYEEGVI
jgi:formyl-CoA transferase